MKVLFDCTYLRNRHTGVDVTFLSLLSSLLYIDPVNHYIVLTDHRYDTKALKQKLKQYPNLEIRRIWCYYPLHVLVTALLMPIYIALKGINVYHNPYFFGPFFKLSRFKSVITVHDLYHKTIPDKMNGLHNILLNTFGDKAIKKANKIIVISSQTKSDVIKYYKIPESKIALIYQAIDSSINLHAVDRDSLKYLSKLDLGGKDYIFSVGKILPSKGIDDLIRAYNLFLSNNPQSNIKLVFAGISDTAYYDEVKLLILRLKIPPNKIIFTGYIEQSELITLYSNAKIYVLPSYFEGFGLTALEAMKFNCPVIVRNASSLPEIVGDAALLFNDIYELSSQIELLLVNQLMVSDYISKGIRQLSKFSNEKKAQETLAIYKD